MPFEGWAASHAPHRRRENDLQGENNRFKEPDNGRKLSTPANKGYEGYKGGGMPSASPCLLHSHDTNSDTNPTQITTQITNYDTNIDTNPDTLASQSLA